MASRELKDEETEMNLTATVIAKDGIAVVVNNENEVEDLTSDQVKAIFHRRDNRMGRSGRVIKPA